MRQTIITAITLFALTTLFGCSSKLSQNEVVGNYEVRYPYGSEKLELHKDGTYFQSVHINNDTSVRTMIGKWEFDKEYSEVILIGALWVDNRYGKINSSFWMYFGGTQAFPARKFFGRISLHINSDLHLAYEKQN